MQGKLGYHNYTFYQSSTAFRQSPVVECDLECDCVSTGVQMYVSTIQYVAHPYQTGRFALASWQALHRGS